MRKKFNVTADCKPELHYMVDISDRLKAIKEMIDEGDYFTMNRARQYGKTTTLRALSKYLSDEYLVISLDFQRFGAEAFHSEYAFVTAFSKRLLLALKNYTLPSDIRQRLEAYADGTKKQIMMDDLFILLNQWCEISVKPIVLLIDEVDSAVSNRVFLDFLAQLRANYIDRDLNATFQSVILAGVQDIKNLKNQFITDGHHIPRSPWNIAADYLVDMSFHAKDIEGMLQEYEQDHHTGMDISVIARLIYDYTSGYPFLVSRICKTLDEQISGSKDFPDDTAAWTASGIAKAVGMILSEKIPLFESLLDKINSFPELRNLLYSILMNGEDFTYNPDNAVIDTAMMYGFVKVADQKIVIANRIFETRIYNLFLTSPEMQATEIYSRGSAAKYQFIKNDVLDMELILERFINTFDEIYGNQPGKFKEEDARRYFLLYLRPIINGKGNYYIEAQTRNHDRTDVIIDYHGTQTVCELKIWRGKAYNERGEKQLSDYLDYFHLNKGYMLSFCFNKTKAKPHMKTIQLGEKVLVEAVV